VVRGLSGIVDGFVRGEIGRRIFWGRRVFFQLERAQRTLVPALLEGTIINNVVKRMIRLGL
jgi:hypothetical protein